MAKYTVFESTNMGSTKYAERIFDAVAATDIENGTFGYLNGLKVISGSNKEPNVYNFVAGTKAGLTAGDIVVVDNPAWDYDTCKITNQRRDKYVIPAGTVFRVRVVKKNDEFGISAEGITAASRTNLDVDAYLTIDSSTGKLVAAASTASTPIMEAVVMRKRNVGNTLVTTAHNYGYTTTIYEAKITTLA